jgi:hypothetical protein
MQKAVKPVKKAAPAKKTVAKKKYNEGGAVPSLGANIFSRRRKQMEEEAGLSDDTGYWEKGSMLKTKPSEPTPVKRQATQAEKDKAAAKKAKQDEQLRRMLKKHEA